MFRAEEILGCNECIHYEVEVYQGTIMAYCNNEPKQNKETGRCENRKEVVGKCLSRHSPAT